MHTSPDEVKSLTPADAFDHAVKLAGGQRALADICDCTQSAISQMNLRDPKRLSHQYVLIVEEKLGIPRSILRPDIYPPEGR